MKYISITLLNIFLFIASSVYSQTSPQTPTDKDFEVSINGGIPSDYDYGEGICIKYVDYPLPNDNNYKFRSVYHATFSIGVYRYWDSHTWNFSNGTVSGKNDIVVLPIMVGFKIGKEKQYFSWELGWAAIRRNPLETLKTFSFAFEGVMLNTKRINLALRYQGQAGSESKYQPYYMGFASMQLTYKFKS